jgi:hypothetical protein
MLLGLPQLRSPPAPVIGTAAVAVAVAVAVVVKSSLIVVSDASVATGTVGSRLFLM